MRSRSEATDTPEAVGLFTIAGTPHGPYPGIAADETDLQGAVTVSWATARQLVNDINRDSGAYSGIWHHSVLQIIGNRVDQEQPASMHFTPDAHKRYTIGGLWRWDDWNGWGETGFPRTRTQAFALGVVEFCYTRGTALPAHLREAYAQGRAAAHEVTRYRYAC